MFRILSILPLEVLNQDKICVMNNNNDSENNHTNNHTDKTTMRNDNITLI